MIISILGAGWLGLPLGKALVQDGHQVKGSTTSADKLPTMEKSGLQGYLLRLDEQGLVSDPSDFFKSDVLIITLPPNGRRDPEVENRYPNQILAILNAAEQAKCQRVLLTSSTGVYGQVEGWVDESTPLQPTTASGRALVKVEQALLNRPGIQASVLRLAGLAGPDRHPGRWFAGKTDIPNGQQYVNLVHQRDVIGVCQAVLKQEAWEQVFNVCADEHPSKAAYYPHATQDWGGDVPTFQVETDGDKGKRIDNQLAKQNLGYSYKYASPFNFDL